MMNSKRILGDEKPKGISMIVWNALMIFAVVGATIAAKAAITSEMEKSDMARYLILGVLGTYSVLIVWGFVYRVKRVSATTQ